MTSPCAPRQAACMLTADADAECTAHALLSTKHLPHRSGRARDRSGGVRAPLQRLVMQSQSRALGRGRRSSPRAQGILQGSPPGCRRTGHHLLHCRLAQGYQLSRAQIHLILQLPAHGLHMMRCNAAGVEAEHKSAFNMHFSGCATVLALELWPNDCKVQVT